MGNSNSHSVHNSLARFSPSSFYSKESRKKKLNKLVSPENKVLPEPVAGQRLRITDNGNILHSGGTISGRKTGSEPPKTPDVDPKFLEMLQRRSEAIQKSANFPRPNGHRKSHSDPDIVRLMMASSSDDGRSSGTDKADNAKSIIAISPSKAKIKSRKKNRAPEPPHSNTLPKALDRIPLYLDKHRDGILQSGGDLPPPPPPPPPDYNGVVKMPSKNYEKNKRHMSKWKLSRDLGEVHKDDRRKCKSLERMEDSRHPKQGDEAQNSFIRSSLRHLDPRHEVIRSLSGTESNARSLSGGHVSDPLPNESKLWTRQQIEQNFVNGYPPRDHSPHVIDRNACTKATVYIGKRGMSTDNCNPNGEVKHYYFTDLKSNQDISVSSPQLTTIHRESNPYEEINEPVFIKGDNSFDYKKCDSRNGFINYGGKHDHKVTQSKIDATKMGGKAKVVSECVNRKRDSHIPKENGNVFQEHTQVLYRPLNHFQRKDSIPKPFCQNRIERNSSHSASGDEETEIDLRLRPTLPRRPVEIPRFSPSEVWKSISLDYAKTYHRSDLSSEEGDVFEEKIRRISRPVAPRRSTSDRCGDSGISPDAGSPMLNDGHFDNGHVSRSQRFMRGSEPHSYKDDMKQTWTPQQDLLDESDGGSNDGMKHDNPISKSESLGVIAQPRFTLPNMFPNRSLPRNPENTVSENNNCTVPEKSKHKGRRKRGSKGNESQHFNSLRNLKKVFGIRSKSTSADQSKGLDTNWSLSRSLPNFIGNFTEEQANYINGDTAANSDSEMRQKCAGREGGDQKHMPVGRPQFSHYSEGHLIYLPEYNGMRIRKDGRKEIGESLSFTKQRTLQDRYKQTQEKKKFSYQSTAKKEERRKLEEQLSREVEENERKRQKEIEWMNRVEEEFRKQRDKEKVNIRHQLRILHLEEEQKSRQKTGDTDRRLKANYAENSDNTSPFSSMNLTDPSTCKATDNKSNDNWKHPTGMSKWLRRHKRGSTDRARSFSPTRPEPEGGSRSSSDECKHFDEKSPESKVTKNNKPVAHITGTQHEEVKDTRYRERNSNSSEYLKREQQGDRSPSPEFYSLPTYQTTPEEVFASPKQKCEWNKGDDRNDVGHSIEEYGVHTRLRRTGSGRTFESHSYYVMESHKEVDGSFRMKTLDVPRNHSVFSSKNFQKELRDNVRRKARETSKHPDPVGESDSGSDDDLRSPAELQQKHRKMKRQQQNIKRNENGFDGGDESSPDEVLNSPGLSFSRNHPHRNAGRIKTHPGNGQVVHKAQDPSAIQLSLVQPFQPIKRSQQVPLRQKLHPTHHCHPTGDSHNRTAVYVQAI